MLPCLLSHTNNNDRQPSHPTNTPQHNPGNSPRLQRSAVAGLGLRSVIRARGRGRRAADFAFGCVVGRDVYVVQVTGAGITTVCGYI